tara:strand:- start:889 stop:1287 length:399 start_codon:yes stop_codon:yes gene_type:complete
MKVRVYRNLTKDTWSIQDYKTRKVIGYSDDIKLSNAKFVVSESGRQRVLKENKKYVHAFVVGELMDDWELFKECEVACYNPYVSELFFTLPYFDIGGKKHGKYNPISKDWIGRVHLIRNSGNQRLTVIKEVA